MGSDSVGVAGGELLPLLLLFASSSCTALFS